MAAAQTIASTLRFVPLAGIISVLLIGVIWRALVQRRRYGTLGIVRFDLKAPAQLARAAGFILFFGVLAVQAFRAARGPAVVHAADRLSPEGVLALSIAGAMGARARASNDRGLELDAIELRFHAECRLDDMVTDHS